MATIEYNTGFDDAQSVNNSPRDNFIYKDISLYFTRNPVTSDVSTVTDIQDIKRAVRHIVLLNPGEKPFHPEIGSNVPHLLFENLNPVTGNQLARTIEEMIGNFEPRARVENVECTPIVDQNKYAVSIYFYVENLPAELQEFQTILETVR